MDFFSPKLCARKIGKHIVFHDYDAFSTVLDALFLKISSSDPTTNSELQIGMNFHEFFDLSTCPFSL